MRNKLAQILLLLLLLQQASAQLCQGSLGDPIVNITFGAGANPGAALNAAGTGYTYSSTDCPLDGSYTVRNNSSGCFGGTWHNIGGDHTGNANGYFMLVNASIQPSAFYIDTVRDLCANTTYEFAAWILNVTNQQSCNGAAIQPNLTFRIERTDGTLLQFYNTNNIPVSVSPEWKQFGFFFTTPVGIPDVVIRIINNAGGGCGNDLALDDITFRPCGPLIVSSIASQTTNTVSLCEGTQQSYTFSCTVSGGFINPSYQWQEKINNGSWIDIPGETNIAFNKNFSAATATGTYAYRLAVAENGNMNSLQCRITSSPLTVNVIANPVTSTSNNSPLCRGEQAVLTASGGVTYQWNGPNGFTASGSPLEINNIQFSQEGKYYVLVKNAQGCSHFDSTSITLKPSPVAVTDFTDGKICSGDSITLFLSGGDTFEWIPTTGLSSANIPSPHASPQSSTQYAGVVSNSVNCTDTAHIHITVLERPNADAGPDKYTIINRPVELDATAMGDEINYSWNVSPYLNDNSLLQPLANPPGNEEFIFSVQSLNGCGNSADTMKVFVYNDVYIPNCFTPNGDAINDTWNIPSLNAFKNFELTVLNRYGEKVFYTKNENKPWDGNFKGKPLPVGAYVYFLDLKTRVAPLKGTVMIIR